MERYNVLRMRLEKIVSCAPFCKVVVTQVPKTCCGVRVSSLHTDESLKHAQLYNLSCVFQ